MKNGGPGGGAAGQQQRQVRQTGRGDLGGRGGGTNKTYSRCSEGKKRGPGSMGLKSSRRRPNISSGVNKSNCGGWYWIMGTVGAS